MQKRIAAAAVTRHGPHQGGTHRVRQQIRKEPADQTAPRGYTAKELRDAVVWREILGPPVSERSER